VHGIGRWIEDLRRDLTFARRQLWRAPGFAVVAAITLALGIGANSAIFALVDATLLRPLPFPDADRLVMVWERTDTEPRSRVAPLNLVDWNERTRTFSGMAAFVPAVGGMVMARPDGTTEDVPRQWLPSANIFDVLGVRAIVGRTFSADDEAQRVNVVVLSEAFWQTRFNRDTSIVGRDIRLDGMPFTVIGVVPHEAQILGEASVWALRPFGRDPALRAPRILLVIGRMQHGVSRQTATADLAAIAAALEQEYPATNKGRGVTVEPLREALVGRDLRVTALLFLGVVGFVLLICCANVANLLLARATVRSRELAVRAALGASRGRVMRQLVTESVLLSVIGGALGMTLGFAILAMAPSFVPAGLLPGAVPLTFDGRVLSFSALTSLFVGVAFGIAPAWQTRQFAAPHINSVNTRTITGAGGLLRNALVIAEVATAVLLLCGAGLLLRTLIAVGSVDRGYRADNALTMMVDPLGSSYPDVAALQQFFHEVETEIRSVPGVRNVAWSSTLPLGPSSAGQFSVEVVGAAPADLHSRPIADYQIVSSTYFDALDLPIVAGRQFTTHDTRNAVAVCIVSEAFVRQQLQGRNPVGTRILLRPAAAPQATPIAREIVGVARQVKGRPDETADVQQVYVPMTQQLIDDLFVIVRPEAGSGDALAASVRAAIARVDKAQLVSVRDVRTLENVAWAATARHRFRAVLVMTLATLALALAMVGVFGTLAYTVQQRVREFGLRMALGASVTSVLRLVVTSAARLVVTGVIVGLVLAAIGARLLAGMLFGVEPLDPITFVIVAVLLMATALASLAGPAWRATRADPAMTLRTE
jgi:putative ABC transport system permease protein